MFRTMFFLVSRYVLTPAQCYASQTSKDTFFWAGKVCIYVKKLCLWTPPNVDNANRRQKKAKATTLQAHVILMQKGIVAFIFANYLDNVLVKKISSSFGDSDRPQVHACIPTYVECVTWSHT
jgi:hypothetical protein